MDIESSADAPAGPASLLPRIEQVVKFVTGSLVLVAAIGLPAVTFHLISFGAPPSTAAYQHVIRAGVLPAVILAVLAVYSVAASKALTRMSLRQFLGFHSLVLLPVLFGAYLVLLVGVLSYALLALWATLWVLRLGLERVVSVSLDNRQLLVISAVILAIIAVVVAIVKLTEKRWATSRFAPLLSRITGPPTRPPARPQPPAEPSLLTAPTGPPAPPSATATSDRPTGGSASKTESRWDWLLGLFFIPMAFLMVYCIKGILHIWDPALGTALTHRYVWYAATAVGVVLGVFIAGIFLAASPTPVSPKATPRQRRLMALGVVLAYLVFEAVYSWWGYPRLHSSWGGGRPQPVTLWLKRDDAGEDITTLLKGARIAEAGSLRRVDRVFVVLDGDKDLLLTDTTRGPATSLLVSRGRLQAISW